MCIPEELPVNTDWSIGSMKRWWKYWCYLLLDITADTLTLAEMIARQASVPVDVLREVSFTLYQRLMSVAFAICFVPRSSRSSAVSHPMSLNHLPIPVDMESLLIFHRAEIHPRFSPDSHFCGLQSNFFRRMVKLLDLDFDELRGLGLQRFRIIFPVPYITGHLRRRRGHPGIIRHLVCHLATIYGCQDNRSLCQKNETRESRLPSDIVPAALTPGARKSGIPCQAPDHNPTPDTATP